MNRKILPRLLNKRREVLEALVKANGNGNNINKILYNANFAISNKLFKNNPSVLISTNRKNKNSLLVKKDNYKALDLYEEYSELE